MQTVLQYVPNGQGLSLSGQALVITSPARPTVNKPAVVPIAITVTGTVNKALNGRSIWILISTPGVNRFYPQGSARDGQDQQSSTPITSGGASPTVTVGLPGNRGRIFYVIAVLAEPKCNNGILELPESGRLHAQFPRAPVATPRGY